MEIRQFFEHFFSVEGISMALGFFLVLVGLWSVLTRKNLIKIVIGFSLFDTGIHIIMVSISYIKGSTAPIIDNTIEADKAAELVSDPVPQALVLTAIVIGLGVTALMLAYVLKMYRAKKSLEINSYTDLKW